MAGISDFFFGQPAETGVQMMGGFRPPAADFARQFGQYLTGMIGQPMPGYPGQVDPGLSPSAQNLISQGQSYSASPMPGIWGGAMGSLGRFMNPSWNQPHQSFPQFFQPPGSPQTSRGPFQMPGQGAMPGGPSMGGGPLPQAPGVPSLPYPGGGGMDGGLKPMMGGGGGGGMQFSAPMMQGGPQASGMPSLPFGGGGGMGGGLKPMLGGGPSMGGGRFPMGGGMTPGGPSMGGGRMPSPGFGRPPMQSLPMPGFGDKAGGMGSGGIGQPLPGFDQARGAAPPSPGWNMTPGGAGGGFAGKPALPTPAFGNPMPGGSGMGDLSGQKPGQWNMTPGGPTGPLTKPGPMQIQPMGPGPTDPASAGAGGYGQTRPGAGGGQEIFLGQGWTNFNQNDPNMQTWARRFQQYGPDAWRGIGQGGGHWGDAGGAFQAINGRQATTQELDDLFFRGGGQQLMQQSAGLPVEQWLRNVGGIAAGPGGRTVRPGYFRQGGG